MLGKRQIVVRLLPTIETMKSKGYTLGAIAKKFTENGIPLTAAALKGILRHVEPGGAVSKTKRRRKRRVPTEGEPPAATPSPIVGTDPISPAEVSATMGAATAETSKGPAAQEAKQGAKPVTKQTTTATPPPKSSGPVQPKEGAQRKGTFTPRPDSDDLLIIVANGDAALG